MNKIKNSEVVLTQTKDGVRWERKGYKEPKENSVNTLRLITLIIQVIGVLVCVYFMIKLETISK